MLQPVEAEEKKEDQEIIYTVVEWYLVEYKVGGRVKVKFNTRKQ